MTTIAKRGTYLCAIGLTLSFVLTIAGIIFYFVPDDGTTKLTALVLLFAGAFFLILGIFDFFAKPKAVILFDRTNKVLLIDRQGKISIPLGTKLTQDLRYYVIPIDDILNAVGDNNPEGGKLGGVIAGPIGYAITVRSFSRLSITYTLKTKKVMATIKNLYDPEAAERRIIKLVNDYASY